MKTSLTVTLFLLLFSVTSLGMELDSLLIKSVGGPVALQRIKELKSYKMTGKINWNGLNGNYLSLVKMPNQVRITADFGAFSVEQGFDGTSAWQKDMHGRFFDLAGFERKEFLRSVYFMSFAYILRGDFLGEAALLDSYESDLMDVYSLNFYPFLNDTVATVFQYEDSLKIRQFARLDNLTVITELTDFQRVDSILFPLHSVSVAENTPMLTEILIDSVALDMELNNSEFSKPVIATTDFHFPADFTSVTIPFIYSNGHVMVTVKVNGVKRGIFILDTGASTTYYDSKFVSDLGLKSVGELPSMGLGGFQPLQLVRMDSLNIGQLTLYDQTAGVLPLDQLASQITAKSTFGGLLGYDFFMRFPVLIDFERLTLTVFNPAMFELPENGISLSFHLCMMIPTVTAELGGFKGDFILDLGNSLGLIIHKKFGENLGALVSPDTSTMSRRHLGGVGQGVQGTILNVTSLQIGAHEITIPEAILAESSEGLTGSWEIAGNIGTKILEQYKLLIDYPQSRVVFYDLGKKGVD